METLPIIEEFDVPRNSFAGVFVGREGSAVDKFGLERGVEGFGHGIVIASSGTAQRGSDTEASKVATEFAGGVLTAAVGMEYGAFRRKGSVDPWVACPVS